MMFDYFTLKVIWWALVGVLLIGFAIMDGHDMGVGILLPFLGKDDTDRRIMINSVAPHWDGNQVWFITAGGAMFAAWPFVYATAFSGFYWAMLLVLFAMFFRPVGFEYRSKLSNPVWRKGWDLGIFVGSFVPALVFGVAFGNLFLGVPFHLDHTMRSFYSGSFWALLNPFALLFGVVSVLMLLLQGSSFLAYRTELDMQKRAITVTRWAVILLLLTFTLAGVWVSTVEGYVITSIGDVGATLNPLMKEVTRVPGSWLHNFLAHPTLWLIPISVYVMGLVVLISLQLGWTLLGFTASSLICFGVILTAGTALFPFILPSSEAPQSSLTVWDSTSSYVTLNVMFWVALIFTPIVIGYTSWAYRVMSGKVTRDYIVSHDKSLY